MSSSANEATLEVEHRVDLIRLAYRLIMTFEVDDPGLSHWVSALGRGLSVEELRSILVNAAPRMELPPSPPPNRLMILSGIRLSGDNPELDFAQVEQAIQNSAAASALTIRLRRI